LHRSQIPFIAILLECITGCINSTSDKSISNNESFGNQKSKEIDQTTTAESPEKTIILFFQWYRANRGKLTSFQLVANADQENFDSTKYYHVNFTETESYLKAVEASGFVSSAYIEKWKKYFLEADKEFRKSPQNDGPPAHFEYDLVMQSQDFEQNLASVEKSKIASRSIDGNSASAELTLLSGQKLKIRLSKQGRSWLIDEIVNATAS
jgi:hypothetical protein